MTYTDARVANLDTLASVSSAHDHNLRLGRGHLRGRGGWPAPDQDRNCGQPKDGRPWTGNPATP
jgi:hypothetical protein